jgi:hypothetical protein
MVYESEQHVKDGNLHSHETGRMYSRKRAHLHAPSAALLGALEEFAAIILWREPSARLDHDGLGADQDSLHEGSDGYLTT